MHLLGFGVSHLQVLEMVSILRCFQVLCLSWVILQLQIPLASAAAMQALTGWEPDRFVADLPTGDAKSLTVIKAGRMVDVETATVEENVTILVSGNRIQKVGKDVPIPAGATIIDLSRKTVLPGLIDCHTHITDENEPDPIVELQTTAADKVLHAIPAARRTLLAGFTSIRDVGTYRALIDVSLRNAIEKGWVDGPRMYVAGAYITSTEGGGAMAGFAPDIKLPEELRYGKADGPWEVRQRVRELAHRGVDFIKVIATGAVLTHGSNPNSVEFSEEELLAATDEARRFGLKVAAHAHATAGIKDAVNAGVASIEHGTFLDDECIALMKAKGTYLVADIYNEDYIQGDAQKNVIPKDFLEHDTGMGQAQRDNFRKAAKAGVKIAFGTDAGVFPHGTNAKQFPYMVRYGLTPMQAIQSATISAADLIGKANLIGSIKAGKLADLIAVDQDPLTHINELENVKFVMKDGRIYKNE